MAPLYLVSQWQINFLVPDETALGNANVEVVRQGAAVLSGSMEISQISPAFFTANQTGMGAPAGDGLRVGAGGQQTAVPIVICLGGISSSAARPIPP